MIAPKHAWQMIGRELPPKRAATARVTDFQEIYLPYDERTVREQASRCLQCPHPLCRTGCPLANRIPEWMALAADGEFLAAADVSASTSNMPEICSRVCPQERLCESMCILNARSDPVAIGAVETFIQEYAFAHRAVNGALAPANGFRVAVVGSGPAGLACADELAKRGYAVTVLESQSAAGGLLMNGIPSFKLEKHIVERRLRVLQARGIKFRTAFRVGRDVSLEELRRGFDAVFLGIGAQQPKPLRIPGAELDGVVQALPFLIEGNSSAAGNHFEVRDKHVVVLGGGDTAMDCLRTALRSGAAEATCLYRRDLDNMPGSRKEYANALEEGAKFNFLVDPTALSGDRAGHVSAIRCVRIGLGEPDASGRRKPAPLIGTEFSITADLVIVAYGFDPEPIPPQNGWPPLLVNEWGALKVDENQMTNAAGVFAGGDVSRGPSLVVHAVRDGRKAALAIDRYLSTPIPK